MKKGNKIKYQIPLNQKITIIVVIIVAIILSIIAIRSPEFNNGSSYSTPNDTSSDYELNIEEDYTDDNYEYNFDSGLGDDEYDSDFYVPDGDN